MAEGLDTGQVKTADAGTSVGYYQAGKCAKSEATYLSYYSLLSERHLHSCGVDGRSLVMIMDGFGRFEV